MTPMLSFTKMSGAGNDFVVLDGRTAADWLERIEWIEALCRRGLSVGADGVLLVTPQAAGRVRVDFRNPDGSRAFCGNGTRCAARYAFSRGMCGSSVILDTDAGAIEAEIDGASVSLKLPAPQSSAAVEIEALSRRFDGRVVHAGVPHLLIPVADVNGAPLELWGPALRHHAALGPDGANVNVVAPCGQSSVAIRTWERGVEGETLACGSAAVAAAFGAHLDGASETVTIWPASGIPLTVRLPGPPEHPPAAILAGDARFIFEGQLHFEGTLVPRSGR